MTGTASTSGRGGPPLIGAPSMRAPRGTEVSPTAVRTSPVHGRLRAGHAPREGRLRRTAPQKRSCSNWSTRAARRSAPRRSSPPTGRPGGCTGRSRSSSSTSGAAAAPAPGARQVPLPRCVVRTPAAATRTPVSRRFAAAARRTYEELGVSPRCCRGGYGPLQPPGPGSGLVEQEYNHLFVGLVTRRCSRIPRRSARRRSSPRPSWPSAMPQAPFSAWFMTVLDAARARGPRADGTRTGSPPGPRAAWRQASGAERQRGPDDLAAARGVLDVAHPARLRGDLATSSRPRPPVSAVVGLQRLGPVRVVVLDGHPDPVRARRRTPRRSPARAARRAVRRW